jgi:two-component system response regulator RegA
MKLARKRLRTLLIVDDDHLLLSALERDLTARGYEVVAASSHERGLEVARAERPDAALLDLYIGEDSGLELLRALKDELPELVVILLSGHAGVQHAVEAFHGGAVDFLQKPIGGKQLLDAIERAAVRAQAGPTSPTLARAELEHITRVLHECNGNISEAARRLGIHRRSLQRKLQKIPH